MGARKGKRAAKPGGVKAHPKVDTSKKRVGSREPVRVEEIDRNGPCPCGSGKKYKKCCAEKPTLWMRIKSLFSRGGASQSGS